MTVRPHADKPRPTPFAEWLTQRRLTLGLRQSDLASRLGIHPGRICEWETGAARPTPQQLRRLLECLGPGIPPPPS